MPRNKSLKDFYLKAKALTVFYVPCSLDSGKDFESTSPLVENSMFGKGRVVERLPRSFALCAKRHFHTPQPILHWGVQSTAIDFSHSGVQVYLAQKKRPPP
jgi:hypothetical protein